LNIALLLLVPASADELEDSDFFNLSLEELMLVNIARRASFSDIGYRSGLAQVKKEQYSNRKDQAI